MRFRLDLANFEVKLVNPATEHSQSLHRLLCDRIAASPGHRITFAEYMNCILYDPQYGYYSSGKVAIGAEGDFFTSSSLGADFGELLAVQIAQMWEILARPVPFTLLEMGAGRGQFAADIFPALQQYDRELFAAIEYIILDRSGSLIQQQQEFLNSWLDKGAKIVWKTWEEIAEASLVGCCFSNELIDAFPVHQVVWEQGELKEVYVTTSEGGFTEVTGELSTPRLRDYFTLVGIELNDPDYPDSYQTEVNLAALTWLEQVVQKLQRGYVLTIDYGYPATRYYHPRRDRGTLQCYYQHRRHHNPYINLGLQDITAHVDFTALERQGERCGLKTLGLTQQGMFLMSLGLGDRLAELSSGKFNVQQVLRRRDALHQLIDPNGLGGFWVLAQSKGLSELEASQTLQGFIAP